MAIPRSPSEIPESERTPLVEWLLNIVAQQQQVIEHQQETISKLEALIRSIGRTGHSPGRATQGEQEAEGQAENPTKQAQPSGGKERLVRETSWFR